MIEQTEEDNILRYQCEECGFTYDERDWAGKCEEWCREHQSCNLEIIQHGQPPQEQ